MSDSEEHGDVVAGAVVASGLGLPVGCRRLAKNASSIVGRLWFVCGMETIFSRGAEDEGCCRGRGSAHITAA